MRVRVHTKSRELIMTDDSFAPGETMMGTETDTPTHT